MVFYTVVALSVHRHLDSQAYTPKLVLTWKPRHVFKCEFAICLNFCIRCAAGRWKYLDIAADLEASLLN